ncbi:MAG TPA: phosphoribosyltransferase [Terriglobia bacterium]|nr:phosphoribosyltransferase [Terriglobia bacterium]
MRGFRDRTEAGRLLAERLSAYARRPDVVVLALPRGGVPVGFEIASRLGAPLDLVIVRKLGVPGQEELAMGAIATGGFQVLNPEVVHILGISETTLASVAARERAELERRERRYRGERPAPAIAGRAVILVDDGIATGTTMRVAIAALKQQSPSRIIVAVPVAPRSTCESLKREVDEVVCLLMPEDFVAIGKWYADFSQVPDEVVCDLLERAGQEARPAAEKRPLESRGPC